MIQTKHRRRVNEKGFTLIELSIVLFIVGLLIAGLVGPVETQLEARDRNETTERMDEIIDALYGYAMSEGRLPCPNTDGDGVEQLDTDLNGTDDYVQFSGAALDALIRSGGACLNAVGFIPWVTLGVQPGDAWGNRISYRLTTPHFSTRDTDGFCDGNDVPQELDLCADGDMQVNTRGDNPGTPGTVEGKFVQAIATTLPAVIISHGRNGFGATSVNGVARALAPANSDELENDGLNPTFVSRVYTNGNNGCADDADESTSLCEFDDIVKWLSPALVSNRMVTAGQLP